MAVCDFCSSPAVRWRYPARDFVVEPLTARLHAEGQPGAGSQGGWAACDGCHALIERTDRQALVLRCARKFAKRYGVPTKLVLPELRALHDQFWSNREGPPIPYEETTDDPHVQGN